jgi:hypothetical protein
MYILSQENGAFLPKISEPDDRFARRRLTISTGIEATRFLGNLEIIVAVKNII